MALCLTSRHQRSIEPGPLAAAVQSLLAGQWPLVARVVEPPYRAATPAHTSFAEAVEPPYRAATPAHTSFAEAVEPPYRAATPAHTSFAEAVELVPCQLRQLASSARPSKRTRRLQSLLSHASHS